MENSNFKDPIGMDNLSTAEDILHLLVYADSLGKLDDVWGKSIHTVSVTGEKAREQTVKSTVIKPALEDYYHILGGKTGTLSAYDARNLAVILEIPESEDKLAVAALYANGEDNASENRFEAARQIADAALLKYENLDYDNSGIDVCCKSAIACVIPGEGADLNNLRILYSKDENAERVPASITKVLTAVCAFDYVSDFEAEFAYKDFDTQIGSFYTKDFFPGDGITFKDALYAMLLPSSNVTARMVARTVGGIILAEEEEQDEGYTGEVFWEQGTITAATGIERDYPNVVRNKGYLELSDYSGITLNSGHYLTYFVYDKDYNYLGNGKADLTANFLLSGEGISTKEMLIRYPEGVYFRVALWRGKNGEMTVDMIPDSGVRFYDAEYGPVIWEMGSLYAKNGITFVREQVIRCISYLPVEDYVGVGIGKGYAVGYLAYDENLNYLGNGNPDKTGYFVTNGFYTEDIIENYPETKYMKLIFREDPIADFTMDAVEKSGVRAYKKGEEFELPEPELKATNIMTMNSCQDGAVCNKKVFLFNNSGNCNVYDIETKTKIGSFTVDKVSILNPHANSVCFGNEFYAEGDKYPLLYVNIYN
ncbi:MAG: hypothetical protein IIU57_05575, partial [Oscillospiraceae bacterium]|nr:hypothetical protein [Oscillospiraceae bacterium]